MLVTQLCPTLCDSMDCSPPGSSVHGVFQARILEWAAIPFSRGSSQPRDQTWVSTLQAFSLYYLSHQGIHNSFYLPSCIIVITMSSIHFGNHINIIQKQFPLGKPRGTVKPTIFTYIFTVSSF